MSPRAGFWRVRFATTWPIVWQPFQDAGKLILGICNGFQVLLQTGALLAANHGPSADVTLTFNDSGKFEDRWVDLATESSRSVFLQGMERLYLPVAHAEGRFVVREPSILDQLESRGQLCLRDARRRRNEANGSVPYPDNPNGSQRSIAGICDETGRVLGLMPHPERYIDRVQHPRWTREELPEQGDGMRLFQNAVAYFS